MIIFITFVFHTLGRIDRVRLISIDSSDLCLDHHSSKKSKRLTPFSATILGDVVEVGVGGGRGVVP